MKSKNQQTILPSFVFTLLVLLLFERCSVHHQTAGRVDRFFKESSVLNDHHVGFALSDLDKGELIYGKEADKYFIPASNTKLVTFYAGLKMMPDSIPSLRYIERGDSLIFWGTGDPSFLQRRLKGDHALNFLKSSHKQLFFAPGRYTGDVYGEGWAWDDYNEDFQAEINELPVMDNLVAFKKEEDKMSVNPPYFNDCLEKGGSITRDEFIITRRLEKNEFIYPDKAIPKEFVQLIPYKTSSLVTLSLLRDTLHLPVQLISMEMPAAAKTVYNMKSEDVFREMLVPSDNFIAEQLLLVYSNQFQQKLSGIDAIHYILNKYLKTLPGQPRWVDGSGLSRMNLFSPRDMIVLLQLIDREMNNREKLFSMLPAGGNRGTLKNAYPKTEHPFVFGKTGTFSNNYNQSGYIITKKGKILAFSFMNNNFTGPVADIKAEMARLVGYIHEKY